MTPTNVSEVNVADFMEQMYYEYGKYVNIGRHFPNIFDGLKPSYRRTIYATMLAGNDLTKSAEICGNVTGKYHPHNERHVAPVISNLVKYGIFEGQGNHGLKSLNKEDLRPAAPRYTEVRLSPKYRDIFGTLLKYVPHQDSQISVKYKEPEYLPTPYPIGLTFGMMGIGVGASNRIPAFSMESLHSAYMNNSIGELRAPFGMTIDWDRSDMVDLWDKGYGKVTYRFKVYRGKSGDGHGTYIEGNPYLFQPNLEELKEWERGGKIHIRDESSGGVSKIFIGRNYRVKSISDDQIYEMALESAYYSKVFRLYTQDGDNIYPIPLGAWLDRSYKNYVSLLNNYKAINIKETEYQIKLYENFEIVVKELFNNRDHSDESLSKATKVDIDIVQSVLSKPINQLKKVNGPAKLQAAKDKLAEFQTLDPASEIDDLITKF